MRKRRNRHHRRRRPAGPAVAVVVGLVMALAPAFAWAQGAGQYGSSPPPKAPQVQDDPDPTPAPAPTPVPAPTPAPTPPEPPSSDTVVPETPADTSSDAVTELGDQGGAPDIEAGKEAASELVDDLVEFNAAIREISFPEEATADVDALLQENRQLLADLKTFRGVETVDGYNEAVLAVDEELEDQRAALQSVEDHLGL